MENGRKDFFAFTTKHSGRTRVLISEIKLSLPFDPQVRDKGKKQPPLFSCKGIWDTGATMSTITEGLVKKLGLSPVGKIEVRNTSGKETKNTYLLNIFLPNKVMLTYVSVVECKELVGEAEFLIGMDVITAGDFSVTNVDGKTTISYRVPSIKEVDYAEEARLIKSQRALQNKFAENQMARRKKMSKKRIKKKRKQERQRRKKARRK